MSISKIIMKRLFVQSIAKSSKIVIDDAFLEPRRPNMVVKNKSRETTEKRMTIDEASESRVMTAHRYYEQIRSSRTESDIIPAWAKLSIASYRPNITSNAK